MAKEVKALHEDGVHIVELASNWYDSTGTFRYKRDNPHEVPATMFEEIPSTATVDGVSPADRKAGKKPVAKTLEPVKDEAEARREAEETAKKAKLEQGEARNQSVAGKL